MRIKASILYIQWPSDRPSRSSVKFARRRNGPDAKPIPLRRLWPSSARRGNPPAARRRIREPGDPAWSTPKIKSDRGWSEKILRGKLSTAITKVISQKRKLTRPLTRRDGPASPAPASISRRRKEPNLNNHRAIAEARRASSYLCRLHRWTRAPRK